MKKMTMGKLRDALKQLQNIPDDAIVLVLVGSQSVAYYVEDVQITGITTHPDNKTEIYLKADSTY